MSSDSVPGPLHLLRVQFCHKSGITESFNGSVLQRTLGNLLHTLSRQNLKYVLLLLGELESEYNAVVVVVKGVLH